MQKASLCPSPLIGQSASDMLYFLHIPQPLTPIEGWSRCPAPLAQVTAPASDWPLPPTTCFHVSSPPWARETDPLCTWDQVSLTTIHM